MRPEQKASHLHQKRRQHLFRSRQLPTQHHLQPSVIISSFRLRRHV